MNVTAYDTDRLIKTLEHSIANWQRRVDDPPFSETLMGGTAITSRANPAVVQFVRAPAMRTPVILLTVGYDDAPASLVLDKKNAAMWARTLRSVSGTTQ